MAKQWGISMANMTNKGGMVILGLVGSGLNSRDVKSLFSEIDKATPVRFINAKVGVSLTMEKL